MEIQFYGANCVRLITKKANLVIDDNLKQLGLKTVTKSSDISLVTNPGIKPEELTARLVIDCPGEYEASDVSIKGIAARSHDDQEQAKSATMYRIIADDVRVGVLGHIFPKLNEDQQEALGTLDILIIPVGNNGYTLDSSGALGLIKAIDPKIVIPTHYADKAINYAVPQNELEDALRGLSMEPKETVSKLKVKPGDLGETTELIVFERQ